MGTPSDWALPYACQKAWRRLRTERQLLQCKQGMRSIKPDDAYSQSVSMALDACWQAQEELKAMFIKTYGL